MNHYEIEASVVQAKNGNHEEFVKILDQYKPFIYKTAKSYNLKDFEISDLAQIGYVALINAVAKYKADSHTFSSYAFNAIKNAYKYTARQNNRYNGDLSLNAHINSDDKSSAEFINCVNYHGSLEDNILKTESAREVRRAISKLPSEYSELIRAVYYEGWSMKTYAEEKGITYLQACRRRKKALEKLNQYLLKKTDNFF